MGDDRGAKAPLIEAAEDGAVLTRPRRSDPATPPDPVISVCIVAGRHRRALEECVASLHAQVSPPPFELLVADSGDGGAADVLGRHFPAARVWPTAGALPGAARNPLVEHARGTLLLFLDDDVTAPPDLLCHLAEMAEADPATTVFGGPNQTPPGSSRFQLVQGSVLASLGGAGPVSRRYGPRHAGPADERWFTLCNLAIRREAMPAFSEHLVCAEENAVLAELRRHGEPMRYDPTLRVFHERRPTVGQFARQMFKYGWGRGALIRRDPRALRAAYLAPTALLAYLLALPAILTAGGAPLALVPAALYVAVVVATAARIGWTLRRAGDAVGALVLIVVVHLCYGAGVPRGVLWPRRGRRRSRAWLG